MKKVNSTVLVVFSMALVSILCLLLGASYSYILSNGSAANTETINTGNLSANITISNINYGNMKASSDQDGIASGNYATINIEKNNQYSVYYQLNLEYTSSYTSNNLANYLPLENVEVALFKITGNSVDTDNPVMGPIRVADLPVVKCDGSGVESVVKAQYQLYVGKFETGSQSAKYALKAWVADDTDDVFNGKTVSLDVTINQEPYRSKNIYNLTFTGADGAELYLNGQKATSGKFTNIVEGTYTLIAKKDNKTYETTLTIKTGDSVKLDTRSPGEQVVNSAVQKLAYDNKTTVYQIIKKNPAIQNSNNLTQYKLYNMPTSYELSVKPSLDVQDISGINITLNDQTGDVTLSYTAPSSVMQSEGPNIFESVTPSVEVSSGDEGGAA